MLDTEECSSLEEMGGSPISRSMGIGRGYLIAGILIAFMAAYYDLRDLSFISVGRLSLLVGGDISFQVKAHGR